LLSPENARSNRSGRQFAPGRRRTLRPGHGCHNKLRWSCAV